MKSIIKITLICLLLMIVFCRDVLSQTEDTIYTVVQDDSVTIFHDQTLKNCASLVRMDAYLENFRMTIIEADTIGPLANCMCYFDLSVKLGPLLAGDYIVDVYETDVFFEDTIFIGSTTFTIGNSGGIRNIPTLSQHQSECYYLTNVDQTSNSIPIGFTFSELYPNPFNPVTNINFFIPLSGYIELNVYNSLGQKVASLINKNLSAGNHLVSWVGSELPSGVYLVRLKYGDVIKTQKAVLIK